MYIHFLDNLGNLRKYEKKKAEIAEKGYNQDKGWKV